MTTYTKVNKPSATLYKAENPEGKEQFDQSNLTYDDLLVFYDSSNQSQYTKISKPTTTTYTKITKP